MQNACHIEMLQTYSKLIKCIEGENFQSAELADIHNRFASDGQTASSIINTLGARHEIFLKKEINFII